MGFNIEQLTQMGIDINTGMDYTGGKDRYLSALQRYYRSFEKNRDNIRSFLDADDMENLSITVHALKSNSKMIGAATLGEKFEALELASKNGESQSVSEGIGPAMEEYGRLIEALKPLGEEAVYKAEGEISGAEAKEAASKLLEALDDFDDDLSMELAEKLTGYPFRMTQKGKLKEAVGLIGEFMYDEAAELIKEIIPAIE